jgi:hypothetical protein
VRAWLDSFGRLGGTRIESRIGVVSEVAILLSFLLGLQRRHGPPLGDEIQERSESTYKDQEPREHHLDPPPPASGL